MNKKRLKLISILLSIVLVFSSCNIIDIIKWGKDKLPDEQEIENSELGENEHPEIDLSKKPRLEDDFYTHVNYDWLINTKIHPTVPTINSFSEVATEMYTVLFADLLKLLEETMAMGEKDEEKLARFFYTAYDWESRDADGINPIKPYLDKISGIKDIKELQEVAAEIDLDMLGTFVMFGIRPDKKDTTVNRLYLSGSPLIMGEKANYFSETESGKNVLNAYEQYILDLLNLAGVTGEKADNIKNNAKYIETYFADSILSLEEAQDDDLIYNKFELNEFSSSLKNLDIVKFLKTIGLVNPEFLIITELDYYRALDSILTDENLEKLKDYMYIQVLHQSVAFLSMDFIKAEKDFLNIQNGAQGYREDYEESFFLTESFMGEIMGKRYVETHFSEDDKIYIKEMVDKIIDMYENRIRSQTWMANETKEKAIEKLRALDVKIGYPDKWTDYSDLAVTIYKDGMEGSVFKNVVNMYHHGYQDSMDELDQPVSTSDWAMEAYETNAYYNPAFNEIVFPAGILQPPFYSSEASESRNLGAIGGIIAHEISHAFDDSGRKFDKNGNRSDWWTKEDIAKYEEQTKKLVEQFNALEVEEGSFVNGKLTLNENISDLSAMTCISDIVKELPDGDLKEMFEGYATIWRSKSTKEYSIKMLSEDVHAPEIFRTNSILSNLDVFYETYNIVENDGMYRKPENRVVIW